MIHRARNEEDFQEPIDESDLLSDEEWSALTIEERRRLQDEWFAEFRAWSLEFRRRAEAEMREIERTRGLFGITTSV